MTKLPGQKQRLCPCCKAVLVCRRWKLDNQLYGEDRTCPDHRCGYRSGWTCDERSGEIHGTTFMRSNAVTAKHARDAAPKGMVPGGDA